jgi:glycerol-3-phosphate dehydrogenase (NAD(P)+)
MKICVLGSGGWGTALGILLHGNRHNITLWEYDKEYAHTLAEFRENFYYLPKVKIPKQVKITNDLGEAVSEKDIILVSTPTQYVRKIIENIKGIDFTNRILLSVSKGIENQSLMTVSNIFLDVFKKIEKKNIAVLSGPSHAEEVAMKIPTAVVASSTDISTAEKIQKTFIAIAAGIAEGAGFGDNTKAAIMTRGIREITRLGVKLGAQSSTFMGLSGIGDLIVTCMSKLSRNRFVGEEIGKGKRLKQVLAEMKMVAEGVATTKSSHELAQKHNVELPIIEQVYKVLFKGKNPHLATEKLMTRGLKHEN